LKKLLEFLKYNEPDRRRCTRHIRENYLCFTIEKLTGLYCEQEETREVMKLSKVAKMIGTDRRTVYNWILNPAIKRFFSDAALNEGDRELDERDIISVNTIAYLRKNVTTDWDEIAQKLEDGYTYSDLSIASVEVDTGKTPLQQFTRSLAIAQERDEALKQLEEAQKELAKIEELHGKEIHQLKSGYEQQLKDERERSKEDLQAQQQKYESKTEALLREIAELKFELGRLQPREANNKHNSPNGTT
jgi:hypothetical protein